MSSGGTSPVGSRYRSKRGAELMRRPNLTEDIIFAIADHLGRDRGPDEVQSSGIESKAGERSDVILVVIGRL